jgi:hypothetical protein
MGALVEIPVTWSAADAMLGARDSRRIGHNTKLQRVGAEFHVVYHETAIIRLTMDGAILNNGGWYTKTTADRLRGFLQSRGWTLTTRKGEWTLVNRATGETVPYRNGMKISGARIVAAA